MRLTIALLALLAALWSVSAQAQDAPTSYELRIYAAGATAPQVTTPFLASATTCNLTLVPAAGPVTNPTAIVWDDTVNVGKKCRYDATSTTGPLLSLPAGSYLGALVAVNAAGSSAESARDPFLRQLAPAARTGVRVIR